LVDRPADLDGRTVPDGSSAAAEGSCAAWAADAVAEREARVYRGAIRDDLVAGRLVTADSKDVESRVGRRPVVHIGGELVRRRWPGTVENCRRLIRCRQRASA